MVKFVVNEGFEHRYRPVTWDDVRWWTLKLLITGQEVREWAAARSSGPFGAGQDAAPRTAVPSQAQM